MRARIAGTGSCLPGLRVTNDDLGKILDTSDEWIRSRTGIGARHIAVEETTAGMSVEAARQALEEAGIQPQDLELIIAATASADHIIPPLSCEVQKGLGAVHAAAYDLCAACSGFIFALSAAQAYIQSGMYHTILVVGAETLSKLLDWSDRSTCVLFGDGAGAAVIRADEEGVMAYIQGSDGSKGDVLSCTGRPVRNPYVKQGWQNRSEQMETGAIMKMSAENRNGWQNRSEQMETGTVQDPYIQMDEQEWKKQFVQMNGQEVYKFAVRTVPKCICQVLDQAELKLEEITWFLLHQANQRIIEAVAKRLKQPLEKFPLCLEECGNISAASIPVLLDKVNKAGKIKRGDKIVLAGFGAGLTWGAAVLVW